MSPASAPRRPARAPTASTRAPPASTPASSSTDDPPAQTTTTKPHLWGPAMWNLLFSLAFRADPDRHADVLHALQHLRRALPCSECRASFSEFCRHVPPPERADALPQWLWKCKDAVNHKLGQKSPRFEKIKQRYALFAVTTSERALVDLVAVCCDADADAASVRGALHHLLTAAQSILSRRFCELALENLPSADADAASLREYAAGLRAVRFG